MSIEENNNNFQKKFINFFKENISQRCPHLYAFFLSENPKNQKNLIFLLSFKWSLYLFF